MTVSDEVLKQIVARIKELEEALEPFTFEELTWLHGNKVMITVPTAAIEKARTAKARGE